MCVREGEDVYTIEFRDERGGDVVEPHRFPGGLLALDTRTGKSEAAN